MEKPIKTIHICTSCGEGYRKKDFDLCPFCGYGSSTTPKVWKPNKYQKKEFIKKMRKS